MSAAPDPLALVEAPIPLAPGVADADPRAAYAERLVRNGELARRVEEVEAAAQETLRRTLRDLLAVADALDRLAALGGDGTTGASADDPRASGVLATRRLLARTLRRHGVERVEVVGTLADPAVVDIGDEAPADAVPEETVLSEVVAAYRWHGEVLRRGQVVVAGGARGEGE